jgi:hypothetical protein
MIGRTLAHYSVTAKLGEGSMGVSDTNVPEEGPLSLRSVKRKETP